jgi:hypothetical protein
MATPTHTMEAVVSPAVTATTVGEWLASLQPPPPQALVERLQCVLEPYAAEPISAVPDVCLRAGEALLEALLTSGSIARGTALDLLAIDALVTYAFEAAADAPDDFEARAAQAMQRIAALPRGSRD